MLFCVVAVNDVVVAPAVGVHWDRKLWATNEETI